MTIQGLQKSWENMQKGKINLSGWETLNVLSKIMIYDVYSTMNLIYLTSFTMSLSFCL